MPCAADERSARFGTMRAFHIADMKKSVNEFRLSFFELMTASKGRRKHIAFLDAVRSRRALRTLWHNACISYRRYEKSMNKFRLSFFELMTASKGRRKRIAFSDAVRSRQALRTLWHNACISYHRYEKIRERISFTDLELMTRLELVTSSLPRMCSTT